MSFLLQPKSFARGLGNSTLPFFCFFDGGTLEVFVPSLLCVASRFRLIVGGCISFLGPVALWEMLVESLKDF